MNNSYQEIMNMIEVTDEMRSRILMNTAEACMQPEKENLAAVECTAAEKKLARNRRRIWNYIAAAAAVIVLGTGIAVFMPRDKGMKEEIQTGIPQMEECDSAEELTQKAGFPVKDVDNIPFDVMSKEYMWCWNEWAQIAYDGSDNRVLFRMARGNEDISGDYNIYDKEINYIEDNVEVILKGNDDLFYLAIWSSADYTYSLSMEQGGTQEEFAAMIRRIAAD